MSLYVAVIRSQTAAMMPYVPPLYISNYPVDGHRVAITIRRSLKSINNLPVAAPDGLLIEVQGEADSLKNAYEGFTNAATFFGDVIAIAVNTPVFRGNLHIIYDNTPGKTEREFEQAYTPETEFVDHEYRLVNVPATIAILQALENDEDRQRLLSRCW